MVFGRHEQHRDIVAAVVAGDADSAEHAMHEHILAARQSFRDVVAGTVDASGDAVAHAGDGRDT
jgi:DNA-binding GntR family transcriptional regulator